MSDVLTTPLRATTSASDAECERHLCFFDSVHNGQNDCFPLKAMKAPLERVLDLNKDTAVRCPDRAVRGSQREIEESFSKELRLKMMGDERSIKSFCLFMVHFLVYEKRHGREKPFA